MLTFVATGMPVVDLHMIRYACIHVRLNKINHKQSPKLLFPRWIISTDMDYTDSKKSVFTIVLKQTHTYIHHFIYISLSNTYLHKTSILVKTTGNYGVLRVREAIIHREEHTI